MTDDPGHHFFHPIFFNQKHIRTFFYYFWWSFFVCHKFNFGSVIFTQIEYNGSNNWLLWNTEMVLTIRKNQKM